MGERQWMNRAGQAAGSGATATAGWTRWDPAALASTVPTLPPLTSRITVRPGELSGAADLAFYRVTQEEALSNPRDHAPGAAVTIKIDRREEHSVLKVHNGPRSARRARADRRHRGFGLIGMRERAGLIGASPAASPTPDGHWPVKLTIPRTAGRPS